MSGILDVIVSLFQFIFELILDVICMALFVASLAFVWRWPVIPSFKVSSRWDFRSAGALNFAAGLFDVVTIACVVPVIPTWRLPSILEALVDDDHGLCAKGRLADYNIQLRFQLILQLFVFLIDLPFALLLLVDAVCFWRWPMLLRLITDANLEAAKNSSSGYVWKRREAIGIVALEAFFDLLSLPMALVVLCSVYRVPQCYRDLSSTTSGASRPKSTMERKLILARHAGLFLIEIPIIVLAVFNVAAVMRAKPFVEDFIALSKAAAGGDCAPWSGDMYSLVFYHAGMTLRDYAAWLVLFPPLLLTVYRGVMVLKSIYDKCKPWAPGLRSPVVVLTRLALEHPPGDRGTGIVLRLHGYRHPDARLPPPGTRVKLYIRNMSEFQQRVSHVFGGTAASLMPVFLPLSLTPDYLDVSSLAALTPMPATLIREAAEEESTSRDDHVGVADDGGVAVPPAASFVIDFSVKNSTSSILKNLAKFSPHTSIALQVEYGAAEGTLVAWRGTLGDLQRSVADPSPRPVSSDASLPGSSSSALNVQTVSDVPLLSSPHCDGDDARRPTPHATSEGRPLPLPQSDPLLAQGQRLCDVAAPVIALSFASFLVDLVAVVCLVLIHAAPQRAWRMYSRACASDERRFALRVRDKLRALVPVIQAQQMFLESEMASLEDSAKEYVPASGPSTGTLRRRSYAPSTSRNRWSWMLRMPVLRSRDYISDGYSTPVGLRCVADANDDDEVFSLRLATAAWRASLLDDVPPKLQDRISRFAASALDPRLAAMGASLPRFVNQHRRGVSLRIQRMTALERSSAMAASVAAGSAFARTTAEEALQIQQAIAASLGKPLTSTSTAAASSNGDGGVTQAARAVPAASGGVVATFVSVATTGRDAPLIALPEAAVSRAPVLSVVELQHSMRRAITDELHSLQAIIADFDVQVIAETSPCGGLSRGGWDGLRKVVFTEVAGVALDLAAAVAFVIVLCSGIRTWSLVHALIAPSESRFEDVVKTAYRSALGSVKDRHQRRSLAMINELAGTPSRQLRCLMQLGELAVDFTYLLKAIFVMLTVTGGISMVGDFVIFLPGHCSFAMARRIIDHHAGYIVTMLLYVLSLVVAWDALRFTVATACFFVFSLGVLLESALGTWTRDSRGRVDVESNSCRAWTFVVLSIGFMLVLPLVVAFHYAEYALPSNVAVVFFSVVGALCVVSGVSAIVKRHDADGAVLRVGRGVVRHIRANLYNSVHYVTIFVEGALLLAVAVVHVAASRADRVTGPNWSGKDVPAQIARWLLLVYRPHPGSVVNASASGNNWTVTQSTGTAPTSTPWPGTTGVSAGPAFSAPSAPLSAYLALLIMVAYLVLSSMPVVIGRILKWRSTKPLTRQPLWLAAVHVAGVSLAPFVCHAVATLVSGADSLLLPVTLCTPSGSGTSSSLSIRWPDCNLGSDVASLSSWTYYASAVWSRPNNAPRFALATACLVLFCYYLPSVAMRNVTVDAIGGREDVVYPQLYRMLTRSAVAAGVVCSVVVLPALASARTLAMGEASLAFGGINPWVSIAPLVVANAWSCGWTLLYGRTLNQAEGVCCSATSVAVWRGAMYGFVTAAGVVLAVVADVAHAWYAIGAVAVAGILVPAVAVCVQARQRCDEDNASDMIRMQLLSLEATLRGDGHTRSAMRLYFDDWQAGGWSTKWRRDVKSAARASQWACLVLCLARHIPAFQLSDTFLATFQAWQASLQAMISPIDAQRIALTYALQMESAAETYNRHFYRAGDMVFCCACFADACSHRRNHVSDSDSDDEGHDSSSAYAALVATPSPPAYVRPSELQRLRETQERLAALVNGLADTAAPPVEPPSAVATDGLPGGAHDDEGGFSRQTSL